MQEISEGSMKKNPHEQPEEDPMLAEGTIVWEELGFDVTLRPPNGHLSDCMAL